MKVGIALCTFILISMFFSSNEPKEHSELEVMLTQVLGISSPSKFEIVTFESSAAIGDYLENYLFKFNASDFNYLMETVRKSDDWELSQFNTYQKIGVFKGHGFNQYIVSADPIKNELYVQFVWE